MRKILVPMDGSGGAMHALDHALALARDGLAIHVELLNVQAPVPVGSLALTPERVRDMLADEAGKVLAPARKVLEQSGIPFQVRSRVGSPASEIAHHCRESGCDAIVMGTRGMGRLAAVMVGSVASGVVHMVDVPVTLVKQPGSGSGG